VPFIIVPTNNSETETIADIMERCVGDTHSHIAAFLAAKGPAPLFMVNGARAGDTTPATMLRLYDQIYKLSEYAHWM